MIKYSPFFPDNALQGVMGSSLPATRNVNLGDWTAIANGTVLSVGDNVQYNGTTYTITNGHTKIGGTATPNVNNDYRLYVAAGAAGANGLNNATIFLYRRSVGFPNKPDSVITYTFSPKNVENLSNSWVTSIPAGTDPLWVTTATASSATNTDTIAANEWSDPVVIAADGTDGTNGVDGLSVARAFLYKRSNTVPTKPAVILRFTFATGTIATPIGGAPDNGWTQTVPGANGQPLYVTSASASASGAADDIDPAEWSAPTILAQDGTNGTNGTNGSNGTNGLNAATVLLYKRSATTPTKPSVASTFTFATGSLTGQDNGWTQTIPGANGQPLWVTTAAAASTTATDSIPGSEWAAPVIITQDGSTGATGLNNATLFAYRRTPSLPAGPDGGIVYTFANAAWNTEPGNGWTKAIPAGTDPLYVVVAVASSTSATDTVLFSDWSAPVLWVQNGATGAPGAAGVGLFTPVISPASSIAQTGTTFRATGATSWGASFYSVESYKGAVVNFKFDFKDREVMIGLNQDPVTNNSYTSIDFALYCNGAGNITAWESASGISLGIDTTKWNTSDIWTIAHMGNCVEYRQNGAVIRRTFVNAGTGGEIYPSSAYYLDSSFSTDDSQVSAVTFGTTTVPVVTDRWRTALVGTTRFGNNFFRSDAGNAWDKGFYTTVGAPQTKVKITLRKNGISAMVGLADDPAITNSYTDIDYALYIRDDNVMEVYSNGSSVANLGTFTLGEVFSVEHQGDSVYIKRNGTIVYTFNNVAAATNLYVDSSLFYYDRGINDVEITTDNALPGVSPLVASVSTPAWIVEANSSGVTKSGQLPKTSTLSFKQGTTEILGQAGTSLEVEYSDAGAISVSISNGIVYLNTANSAGYVDIKFLKDGVLKDTKRISITRNVESPPPASQTNDAMAVSISIPGTGTSNSYPASPSYVLTMKPNGGGSLTAGASGEYYVGASVGTKTCRGAFKMLIRSVGGSWVDFGAEVQGTTSTSISGGEPSPGTFSLSQTYNGLSSTTTYEVGLVMRKFSGTTGEAASGDGQQSVTQ